MSIEAMKLALEALKSCSGVSHWPALQPTIAALRQAIEQAEQVQPKCGAIIEVFGKDWRLEYMSLPVGKHKLYTQQYEYTAPPPSRKPLTYPQIHELDWPDGVAFEEILLFVRAIEAAHGIGEKA